MKFWRLFSLSLLAPLLAIPFFSFAVTEDEAFESLRAKYPSIPEEVLRKIPITTGPSIPESVEAAGNISCFDYYTFGSVTAEPNGEIKEVIAGSSVDIAVKIQNNNPYPIVDGTLWVKIFRKAENETARLVNGDHLVDFFPIVTDVVLTPSEVEGYSFSWNTPPDAISGEYYAATFFTTGDAYNLLGLTFTDDIVGGVYYFSVLDGVGSPYLDKSSVAIANNPYQFIGAPPVVDSVAPVPISISIVNPTNDSRSVQIVWNVYRWDALTAKNLLETSAVETVSIEPNSQQEVVYTIRAVDAAVYLVVPEILTEGAGSLAHIRFIRSGVDMLRLNFPSITEYPLYSRAPVQVFACLHNAGLAASVPDAVLNLVVKDRFGRAIHTHQYKGVVTGAMMGELSEFASFFEHKTFSIEATLLADGAVVDFGTVKYRCEDLGENQCWSDAIINPIPLGTIFVFLFVTLLILTKWFRKSKSL